MRIVTNNTADCGSALLAGSPAQSVRTPISPPAAIRRDNASLSIILCTSNRAESLAQTLAALNCLIVPQGMNVELIVVDNNSQDHTASIFREFAPSRLRPRMVIERRPGLSYSRNAGIAESSGEIVLFTDDDVRPPPNWIDGMCTPIVTGLADAVAGGVTLAPHLVKPWMDPMHLIWFAATPGPDGAVPDAMVGANMAFSRDVLRRVPGFDVELGAGALGYMEETLFSLQLKRAGYRLVSRYQIAVEHHFDANRLKKATLIEAAAKRGRSSAYIHHHWEHRRFPLAHLHMKRKALSIACARTDENNSGEGVSPKLLHDLRSLHLYHHCIQLASDPRNYDAFGMIKIRGKGIVRSLTRNGCLVRL